MDKPRNVCTHLTLCIYKKKLCFSQRNVGILGGGFATDKSVVKPIKSNLKILKNLLHCSGTDQSII